MREERVGIYGLISCTIESISMIPSGCTLPRETRVAQKTNERRLDAHDDDNDYDDGDLSSGG